jgi:hypothetical protein
LRGLSIVVVDEIVNHLIPRSDRLRRVRRIVNGRAASFVAASVCDLKHAFFLSCESVCPNGRRLQQLPYLSLNMDR